MIIQCPMSFKKNHEFMSMKKAFNRERNTIAVVFFTGTIELA